MKRRCLALVVCAISVSAVVPPARGQDKDQGPARERPAVAAGSETRDEPGSGTAARPDAKPDAGIPPIKEIAKLAPKDSAFKPGRPPQPTVLHSAKEAGECFAEEALARLAKEVDFARQTVLLFAWRGSGQDRLEFAVAESYPEQVTFSYKAGRTRDLRTHVRVYALRSNVKWSMAGAAPKPKPAKPAGGEVSWDEMKDLIQKGQVQSVMQTHSRRVTAVMADGTRYEATEPGLDDVIKLIRESGKDIPIATE